jgi:hypothetical protein
MKTIIAILFTFISGLIFSQDVEWYTHFDSELRQSLRSVEVSESGEIITSITSYGDFIPDISNPNQKLVQTGSYGAVIGKYGEDGSHIWSFLLSNEGRTEVSDLVLDNQGNVVIIGQFNGSSAVDMDPDEGVTFFQGGNSDHSFIAKYSPEGSLIWALPYYEGAAGNHYIDTDANGNIYVLSRFLGTITPYGGTESIISTGTGADAFIAKYDTDGNLLWTYSIKSDERINPSSIQIINGKVVSLVGFVDHISTGSNDYNGTHSGTNYIILTLGTDGNYERSIMFAAEANFYIVGIQPIQEDYIITGRFNGSFSYNGSEMISSTDGFDAYVARIEQNGAVKWIKTAEGVGNDFMNLLGMTLDGNIELGLYFEDDVSFLDESFTSAGKFDYVIMRLSENGDLMFNQHIATSESDLINYFKSNPDGSALVIGSFRNTLDIDILNEDNSIAVTCDDDADVYFVKYRASSSPVTDVIPERNLMIYPNPSNGYIKLRSDSHQSLGQVRIYNIYGQLVHSEYSTLTSELELNLPDHPGMYLLHASGKTIRIIRQ